jgi:hypothetical protein
MFSLQTAFFDILSVIVRLLAPLEQVFSLGQAVP